MVKQVFALLALSIFLGGCSTIKSEQPSSFGTTLPPSPASTLLVSPILAPTQTPLPPTRSATLAPSLTPTVTNTLTNLPDMLNYQCLEIADHPPDDYIQEGILVFKTDDNLDAWLNDGTGTIRRIPRETGDRLFGFDVSPDRSRILYYQSINTGGWMVDIATADGQPIWSQPASSDTWWFWFDNDRLMSWVPQTEGLPYLTILNIYTGERIDLQQNFPNIYDADSGLFSGFVSSFGRTVYDPTLTRVIYPACDSACRERLIRGEPGYPIVLWDIERGIELASLLTTDFWGETPIWQQDGSYFIIATKVNPSYPYPPADEFFSVSREGEIKQLTHFTDYYQDVEIQDTYSLSPNGQYVAFWIVAKPSSYNDDRLAILDTTTGEVTNYCIAGGTFMGNVVPQIRPIWSPDNTQLIVYPGESQDAEHRRVVLVDIVHGFAAQIAEDIDLVGWMVSP